MSCADTVTVLLVEDDDVDRRVVHRAFAQRGLANPIVDASDGTEALETLRGEHGRGPLPRPYLVLLDLNMPGMNGMAFLEEIRRDDELKDVVVFVLTASRDEQDRVQAHRLNVAGYMVKADVGTEFIKTVEMLDRYWRVVEFPC
ncbi:MAG: response regulator [Phycisphaerae bacterium]|jgi:CheY-like chemotaxis protein